MFLRPQTSPALGLTIRSECSVELTVQLGSPSRRLVGLQSATD